jgi:site-specific DNA-methyltransferase (adenine-specific)
MQKNDILLRISNIEHINVYIKDILIENRFREDLGDIDSLASSISKEGLIQAISICMNPNYTAEDPDSQYYKLLAGGRRFAAISHIAATHKLEKITCRLYPGELSELQMRMLEFAENLYRKDMTWQEEDRLKRRIYELQQQIHGKKTSTAKDAPGFSLADMSKMTGSSKGSLSESISLAKMMDSTPGVNWDGFKTRSDAMKAVKGAKKVVKQSADAKIAVASMGEGDTKKKKLINSYHVRDFFEGVKKIGNNTIDFVEIDPPYSIDLKNVKKDYDYSSYTEIHPDKYPDFMLRLFKESYRVLKPNSWLICWFGAEPWHEKIYQWLCEVSFKTTRLCGIWIKGQGQSLNPDRCLANSYETFFYARKGSPLLNKPGSTNVFDYSPIPPQLKVHPTERSIELMEDILTTFTAPNSNVLVPFAGSGNTLIAAAKQQMIPIGFDLAVEYHESYSIKIHKMF